MPLTQESAMNEACLPESTVRLRAERDAYRLERDLFRRLLELGLHTDVEALLRDALALIVDVAKVRQGYLELHGDNEAAPWWMAHGCSDQTVEDVRATVSKGIIAMAIADGRTIVTSSALIDERFSARESVQDGQIEAVLCAPIGEPIPRGVLYLQGREVPEPFSPADKDRAEVFARHLALYADRLIAERRNRTATDPLERLRQTLRLDGVVGRSDALVAVLQQAALLAPLDVTVLLTGDCGTGKTQLARIIHDSGPRASHPFVEVSCATLPEGLFESELFGAMPGAHSTATRRIEGRVTFADRGTLFLDEISELSMNAQAKLLQFLQSKQYNPLAGRPTQADVRVIAATNTDLTAAVAARRFREDLLYRLQVMPIRMPTIAERAEDIPEFADAFCATFAHRYGLGRLRLSDAARRALQTAEWPGNVRQLEHAVEAAVIRASGEGVFEVQRRHVFPEGAGRTAESPTDQTFQDATRRFQARHLHEVLEETDWNVAEAARRLDLAKSHVYNLIKAFGLARDK
jgi:Nif-specific regulatory protein